MVWFLKNRTGSNSAVCSRSRNRGPIGIDVSEHSVLIAQLRPNENGAVLIAGGSRIRPADIKPGTGDWQRWAIESIRELIGKGRFQGRSVVATIPTAEVFIDHVRVPGSNGQHVSDEKLLAVVRSKIGRKLPFSGDDAVIKCVPTEENHTVAIAMERKIIDRHLAIYEQANLVIKSICVWPLALVNSYVRFFGRRQSDLEAVVMLLEINANRTNVVVCRHKSLLFARSIAIGTEQLESDEMVTRLILELTASKRHFNSMYRKIQIERAIFLASQDAGKAISARIAKQLEMPAQMGDCLAAVKVSDPAWAGIDKCEFNWTNAFGLSLS